MLRYIHGHDLHRFPKLADSMFKHRADQFARRLKWDVSVGQDGQERDEYDALDPLYVIWERPDGTHGGSMRFLPTVGRTMIAEHFGELTGNITIQSPLIWECTRFCLATDAEPFVTSALVLGAGEIMDNFHLSHFVGVFDYRMQRIYNRLRVTPDVIGQKGEGRDMLGVGLWEMTQEAWEPTLSKVGVTREISKDWFHQSIALKPEQSVFAIAG